MDPSNRRLNEHGIYIRHCQESNSQAGVNTTRPQPASTNQYFSLLQCEVLACERSCWGTSTLKVF